MATILIADDDDSLREMIRYALELQQHRVIEAKDGEEALEIFQTKIFDMALLDVNMGDGLTGFEVCRAMRQDPYGAAIPIVFLTGMNSEENLVQGFQEGADDFIRKPFTILELLARINGQVNRLQRQHKTSVKMGERQFEAGSLIEGEYGTYQIDRRIAAGGMGVIFHGFRTSDNLQVAIKTLNSNSLENHKDIQRFLREANTTLQINHPNLARGVEVVRSAEYFFFVMEYIEGKNLGNILNEEQTISLDQAIQIVYQIAQGLEYLNNLGIVHRDIKPANIILSPTNQAVLVDMGLSREEAMGNTITTSGVLLGTPYYLSPEQVQGKRVDIRSDIYSLGVTFFFIITGVVPFVDDVDNSTASVLNAKFVKELEDPRALIPDLSEDIYLMIKKMTNPSRKNRYQNPGKLLEDLSQILP